MTIYFLGDVHGKFDHILPAIEKDNPDSEPAVIFLGDIESPVSFEDMIEPLLKAGVQVWFIHGNHDTDNNQNWNNLKDSQHRNLHARVVEVQGLKIAGLGGVFRSEVWYPGEPDDTGINSYSDYIKHLKAKTPPRLHASIKNTNRALKHLSTIFPDTYNNLASMQADILVTHEASSCHPNGFAVLDGLALAMGVKTLFHGHQHDNLDYTLLGVDYGFDARGVGLRGIADQDMRCVLKGEQDDERMYRQWVKSRS